MLKCERCAQAIKHIEESGGVVVKWTCTHYPHLLVDTKPYKVVWVDMDEAKREEK